MKIFTASMLCLCTFTLLSFTCKSKDAVRRIEMDSATVTATVDRKYYQPDSSAAVSFKLKKFAASKMQVKDIDDKLVDAGSAVKTGINSEIGNTLFVDQFGGLDMANPEVYSEDISTIVGHVADITSAQNNKLTFNVYGTSVVEPSKQFASKAVAPLNAHVIAKKATRKEIIDAKLIFLDAGISNEEFYEYTNEPVLSLSLKAEYINKPVLASYNCPEGQLCDTRYVVDWAQVRRITTSKYKKADRNIKVKNLPPFISAVVSGGEFAVMRDNSDKQVMYKLLIHVTPIRYWIK